MWQMVFAHISVEGWTIDPYVQSHFYCPDLVQVLPPNNFEIIDGNTVTTDVTMVIYGRGGFQMFLEPFSKSSRGLSNIFLITVHPVTMISVDDSTLFLHWIFVLWRHQEVLDGSASFTMHLHPKFPVNVFDALAEPSIVRYHYMWVMLLFVLLVCFLAGLFIFCCILFIAHVGYWQFFSAFFRCFSSLCNSGVLEQMVFALCCSVPITLYFDGGDCPTVGRDLCEWVS